MTSTTVHESPGARTPRDATAPRILLAVHGYEPRGWSRELPTAVLRTGLVQVLVVDDAVAPAFTSVLPTARRFYGAALAAQRREEEARRDAVLEALLPELPSPAEVVRITASPDPGRAIAAWAGQWPADVVVVGRDGRSRLERALLGAIHERVVERAACAVLVVPAAAPVLLARPAADGQVLPPRAAAHGGA
jgi:nucleotide-binding universal stress UspA family protein